MRADLAHMQLISNIVKDFNFCYLSSIFLVNMHVLFLGKTKKLLQLLMSFKKFEINRIANQEKHEWVKVASFTIDQWNRGCRMII